MAKLTLEDRFAAAWAAQWDQMDALGVPTARLRKTAGELGSLAAAKRCLSGRRPSDGFAALIAKGKGELTLEALALKSPWGDLFTDEEANEAIGRLMEAGYF